MNCRRSICFTKRYEMKLLEFTIERDDKSGAFTASWDDPKGGGITTQAYSLAELPEQRFLRLEGVANVQGIASLPVKRLERKLGDLPRDVLDKIKQTVAFALDIG